MNLKQILLAAALVCGAASAQVLLSGDWTPRQHEDQPERGPGPDLGDYLGLPINDAARLRAESWDASRLTLPEEQCRVHVAPYIFRGPLALRIWEEKDPETQQLIAIKNYVSTYEQTRTIWMDGRPHPPEYAPHTWMGFSTGKWEGNMLTVYTTHLKTGWIRRNGVPESDQATMVEHFLRFGDVLTHVTIVTDPAYLAEPLIRTEEFVLNLSGQTNWLWPCEYVVEIERPKGTVQHYLPGENPFLKEFTSRHNLPAAAASAGPETIYPEYRANMRKSAAVAPRENQNRPRRVAESVEAFPVQGNIYLLSGAGGNITVQAGNTGVLMVDTGAGSASGKVVAAVQKLSAKPIRHIINTSVDADHTGGNVHIAEVGGKARSIVLVNTPGATATETVQILAHQKVLDRMSAPEGAQAPVPSDAWPTETYVGSGKDFYFNGEPIMVYHLPSAHTDGDSIVFFRRSDVVATGDIFATDAYPVIDLEKGGSLQGIIDGLNFVLDLTVPAHAQEGGTMVIPGHGRICDEADVVEYRDMLTIIRDRIQAMIKKGMTVAQVKAARPTLDYDPLYGATTGAWTTEMFVETAYQSLVKSPKK